MVERRFSFFVRAQIRYFAGDAPDLGLSRIAAGRRRVVGVALATSLLLAACGADQTREAVSLPTSANPTGVAGETTNVFPDLDVVSVATGETVNLKAELSGGDLPVLLWFWAPH